MAAFSPIKPLNTGMAGGAPMGQKTIQPVQQQAPAFNPRAMKGVGFDQIAKNTPVGQSIYNQLFASKDFTGIGDGYGPENNRWRGAEVQGPGDTGFLQGPQTGGLNGTWATEMGNNEGGTPNYVPNPNQGAIDAFKDYKFDWTQGDRNAGTLTGYDPSGNKIGSWDQQPEPSTISQMGQALALAAAGFGGVGLMGLGPLGGVLGGAGGAGAGAGAAGGEAAAIGSMSGAGAAGDIGFLAANGLTDAAIASSFPGLASAGGLTGVGGTLGAAGAASALSDGSGLSLESAPLPGGEEFAFQNVGAAAEAPAYTTAAADSQLASSQLASSQLGISGAEAAGAATAPATVNLGSLGGTMGTAGGITGAIAGALADPANALKAAGSSVLDFAKENPRLAAMGVGALGQLAGGSPSLPSLPGASGGAGGGSSALATALENQIGQMGAPDYSGVPGLKSTAGDRNTLNQEAIDAAYSQQTRMLDPQFARDRQAMEARLAEQGFVPGTPGYERAMQIFGETRNQAYGAARDSSILQGYEIGQGDFRNAISDAELNNASSREALAQILAKRNQPFNELASIKGNQQIDYNNQIDRYNAQAASSNSKNQALSQLALALGMYLG